MEQTFGASELRIQLVTELASTLEKHVQTQPWLACDTTLSASYLLEEMAQADDKFIVKESQC